MSLFYTHVQSTPSLTWTITHNLNGPTMGDVIEDNGGVIRKILPASVKHITDDSMLVEFSEPTKGLVRLVGIFEPTASSGAGAIDPGQYYVAPAPADIVFDSGKKSNGITLSNGDLTVYANNNGYENVLTDLSVTTGKYYWEVTVDALTDPADMFVGLCAEPSNSQYDVFFNAAEFAPYAALRSMGTKFVSTGGSTAGGTQVYSTLGTVVGIAVDLDADKVWFSINGSWEFAADPATGDTPGISGAGFGSTPVYPFIGTDNNTGAVQATAAFSESQYTYAIPAGFSDFTGV